jgi:2-dehydro-3-deoxyphosphogluconate aldolase/(4S)-4-hydroxy-2-oxoglutarate aldolase
MIQQITGNEADEATAKRTADSFANLFGFEQRDGSSSIFAGSGIEVMKSGGYGRHGHIAIQTNYINRAIAHLRNKSISVIPDSAKYDNKGQLKAIYLDAEVDFNQVSVSDVQKLAGGDGSGRVQR